MPELKSAAPVASGINRELLVVVGIGKFDANNGKVSGAPRIQIKLRLAFPQPADMETAVTSDRRISVRIDQPDLGQPYAKRDLAKRILRCWGDKSLVGIGNDNLTLEHDPVVHLD